MNRAVVAAAAATTFAVTGLAGAANTALAARPSPSHPAGHISGIVPSHGLHAAKPRSSGSNLSYHGGPVEHNGTVYLLFWNPDNAGTWAPGYQTIVEKYFTDVAAATSASAQTNVYWAATQYTDGSGAVGIPTTVGDPGGITDNGNGVVSGCSDTGTVLCVTDGQIQSEVSTQVSANHWNVGPNDEVFVFTAKGIGSCAGNQCAFSYYCAYHSWFGSGSSVQLYANMPYADTNPSACGTGEQPNGNDADDTINVTSHEHNETLTDEQGNAWYDSRGQEDGDKCAWTFGTAIGGTSGALYNQNINGGHYYLQREWSNHSTGCVLTGL